MTRDEIDKAIEHGVHTAMAARASVRDYPSHIRAALEAAGLQICDVAAIRADERRKALEEAARMAESFAYGLPLEKLTATGQTHDQACDMIAAAIRKMMEGNDG